MKKYLSVFKTSWSNEFTYRLNFILWRVRNVLRLLMTYFLWQGVFVANVLLFGYTRSQILAYVFLVLIVQSIVLSAPSADSIGGEIGSGDLSNFLVKPMGYLKYWFTRDLASKLLNIVFSVFEVSLLWIFLRPDLRIPLSPTLFLGFLASCFLAVLLYFFLGTASRSIAFWAPEQTWTLAFMLMVIMETLAGGIFPLDILPAPLFTLLQFTPFPYLVYYPIAILIGKITGWHLIRILIQGSILVLIMSRLTNIIWHKGLRVYGSEGR